MATQGNLTGSPFCYVNMYRCRSNGASNTNFLFPGKGSRTKNGPSAKTSGRGTKCHVVSGRGLLLFTHVGGAQFPLSVYLLAVQPATNARTRRDLETRLNGAGLVNAGLTRDNFSTFQLLVYHIQYHTYLFSNSNPYRLYFHFLLTLQLYRVNTLFRERSSFAAR